MMIKISLGVLFLIVTLAISLPQQVIANPTSVTVAGNFQSELGCPGDWQPDCPVSHLTYDLFDQVWQGVFTVPAGNWEYKAALDNAWTINYGANATQNGANIPLSLPIGINVKFYYDDKTHWITDNQNSVIAVAVGSFQSELGAPGDWDPSNLLSWLQDPDGNGIYTFSAILPVGSYEAKVAYNENWDINYGQGGVQNGPNIPFSIPDEGLLTSFSYNPTNHILSVQVENSEVPVPEPTTMMLLASGLLSLWGLWRIFLKLNLLKISIK